MAAVAWRAWCRLFALTACTIITRVDVVAAVDVEERFALDALLSLSPTTDSTSPLSRCKWSSTLSGTVPSDADPCTFRGVTCNVDQHVVYVGPQLAALCRLHGAALQSVCALTTRGVCAVDRSLVLRRKGLEGALPTSISLLASLTYG